MSSLSLVIGKETKATPSIFGGPLLETNSLGEVD